MNQTILAWQGHNTTVRIAFVCYGNSWGVVELFSLILEARKMPHGMIELCSGPNRPKPNFEGCHMEGGARLCLGHERLRDVPSVGGEQAP